MDEQAIKKLQGENAEDLPEVADSLDEREPADQSDADLEAQGLMSVQSLPQDVRDQLPEDAQHIFVAAFNSIFENNGDREQAMTVAWQTIEHSDRYVKGANGKWEAAFQGDAEHNPSPKSAA